MKLSLEGCCIRRCVGKMQLCAITQRWCYFACYVARMTKFFATWLIIIADRPLSGLHLTLLANWHLTTERDSGWFTPDGHLKVEARIPHAASRMLLLTALRFQADVTRELTADVQSMFCCAHLAGAHGIHQTEGHEHFRWWCDERSHHAGGYRTAAPVGPEVARQPVFPTRVHWS